MSDNELPDNEISFFLVDDENDINAMFSTYQDKPGEIFISIFEREDEGEDGNTYYREPTEEELEKVSLHPFSFRLRIDLILESGKQWESWKGHAQHVLNKALAGQQETGEA